ncbi:hypothetical protein HWV62_45059 [Athelia sp. TMB]|nr:hypothetical protein HWV62_45059 [Athelia sp. TMB]
MSRNVHVYWLPKNTVAVHTTDRMYDNQIYVSPNVSTAPNAHQLLHLNDLYSDPISPFDCHTLRFSSNAHPFLGFSIPDITFNCKLLEPLKHTAQSLPVVVDDRGLYQLQPSLCIQWFNLEYDLVLMNHELMTKLDIQYVGSPFRLPSQYKFQEARPQRHQVQKIALEARDAFRPIIAHTSWLIAMLHPIGKPFDLLNEEWCLQMMREQHSTAQWFHELADSPIATFTRQVGRIGVVVTLDCSYLKFIPAFIQANVPVWFVWNHPMHYANTPCAIHLPHRDLVIAAKERTERSTSPATTFVNANQAQSTTSAMAFMKAPLAQHNASSATPLAEAPEPEPGSRQKKGESVFQFITRYEEENKSKAARESPQEREARLAREKAQSSFPLPGKKGPKVWSWEQDGAFWVRTYMSRAEVDLRWGDIPNEHLKYNAFRNEWDYCEAFDPEAEPPADEYDEELHDFYLHGEKATSVEGTSIPEAIVPSTENPVKPIAEVGAIPGAEASNMQTDTPLDEVAAQGSTGGERCEPMSVERNSIPEDAVIPSAENPATGIAEQDAIPSVEASDMQTDTPVEVPAEGSTSGERCEPMSVERSSIPEDAITPSAENPATGIAEQDAIPSVEASDMQTDTPLDEVSANGSIGGGGCKLQTDGLLRSYIAPPLVGSPPVLERLEDILRFRCGFHGHPGSTDIVETPVIPLRAWQNAGQAPMPRPNDDQTWRTTRRALSDTTSEWKSDEFKNAQVMEFVRLVSSSERVPPALWDMDVDSVDPIQAVGKHASIRPIKLGSRTVYDIIPHAAENTDEPSWKLVVEDATTALECVRAAPPDTTRQSLAEFFFITGRPFRTLRCAPPTDPIPALPVRSLGSRPQNFLASAIDLRAYEYRRGRFLKSDRARAAALHGGIVWRLTMESFTREQISDGPTDLATSLYNRMDGESDGAWDDQLSEEELDLICGVYKVHTGACCSSSLNQRMELNLCFYHRPPSICRSTGTCFLVAKAFHLDEKFYERRPVDCHQRDLVSKQDEEAGHGADAGHEPARTPEDPKTVGRVT